MRGILCWGDPLKFDKVAKLVMELLTFIVALCAAIFSAMNYLSAEYNPQTIVCMFFVLSVVGLSCVLYSISTVLHRKYGTDSDNSSKILAAIGIPLIIYNGVVLFSINANTSTYYTFGYVVASFVIGAVGGYLAYARGSRGDSALDTMRNLLYNHPIVAIVCITAVFTICSLTVILKILSAPS